MARIAPMTPIFQKGQPKRRVIPTADGQRKPRVRDGKHMSCIACLPCCVCLSRPVHVAHVRMSDIERGKPISGKSEKPSDKWTVPLCPAHHVDGPDAQHKSSERDWWKHQGIDAIALCIELYAATGGLMLMEQIVLRARDAALISAANAEVTGQER